MEMTFAQQLGQQAFMEAMRLRDLPETSERIIAEARKCYPKLPPLIEAEWRLSALIGTDKGGRRWVIHGHWVTTGIFDMNTILRETRRQHGISWLLGGQAEKNCKNVWGTPDPVRITFHEIERLMKAYAALMF